MSTGLLPTPDIAGRKVTLKVTDLPAGSPLEIWRTDANGTRRVRLPRAAAPDANGGYLVADHEAALTGSLSYKITGNRTNEISNPYFTTDTAGWSFGGTGSAIVRDTAEYRSSPASLKFTTANAGSDVRYTFPVAAHLRNADTRVYVHGYAKGTGSFQITARGMSAAGASTGDIYSDVIPLTSTWQRVFVELVGLTSETETIHCIFWQRTSGAQTLWLDDALAEINGPTGARGVFLGTYTAQGITQATSLEQAGRDGVWIHAAAYPKTLPHLAGLVLEDWSPSRDTGAQLHDVIGRADPIDTGAGPRTRSHRLELRAPDWSTAAALEALVAPTDTAGALPPAKSRTLVVRQTTNPGMDATVTVERLDLAPDQAHTSPRRWHVTLAGRETLTGPALEDTPT